MPRRPEAPDVPRRSWRDELRAMREGTAETDESGHGRGVSSVSTVTRDDGAIRAERVSSVSAGTARAAAQSDPFVRWRLSNTKRLTADDLARGYDAGGYCAAHGRRLSYPEQKRGACSWCIPVDPEREPEYWESHWRKFTARADP